MSKAVFDAARTIKGAPLTQADVALMNAALGIAPTPVSDSPDPELIAALKQDEGLRLTAYLDTVGVWTIGYGHTGPEVKRGLVWTAEKAEQVFIEDIKSHNAKLYARAPWIRQLDPVRRRVLENMAFNLGIDGLLGFKNTLKAVQDGRYDDAANGMLASLWAKQVKGRAVRLAQEMRTGRA